MTIALHCTRSVNFGIWSNWQASSAGELDSGTNLQVNIHDGMPKLPIDGNGVPILPPGVGPYVIAYLDAVLSADAD